MIQLDHILYGVPDLEAGMAQFEVLSGVRPVYGGRHEKLGTHNALVSLGDASYLELIAPDPSQSIPRAEIIFGLGTLTTPRIVTWALRSDDSGLVPFLIHWRSQPHPAQSSPAGCSLLAFAAAHPHPGLFTPLFATLQYRFHIAQGSTPTLSATLATPKGRIVI